MKLIKFLLCFLLIGLSSCLWVQADSEGAGCYGPGYVAYEKHFDDPTGLYLVFFGNPQGISDPIRVALPRSPGAYLFGIQCNQGSIYIALRGEERRIAPNTIEIPIYKTEISLADRANPSVVSDKKDHVQVWQNYTTKHLRGLDGKEGTFVELPKPSIDLTAHPLAAKNLELPSDDRAHKYYLVYEVSRSSSATGGGYGYIESRTHALIVQKDLNGKNVYEKKLMESTLTEGVDTHGQARGTNFKSLQTSFDLNPGVVAIARI